jgi:Xaa-Pro dipeptidase
MPLTPEEVADSLDVSEVYYQREFEAKFKELQAQTVHTLPNYSLPTSESKSNVKAVDKYLLMACQEARLRKSPAEIDLIQVANDISSRAHEGVMKALGAGDTHSEHEASAVFSYYCAKSNAKSMAYEVIAASGTNAGTLHYIKNKKSFPSSGEGSLLLLDAGCEHNSYAADITRTFPIGNGGKYTSEAKNVYHLVEEMQDAAFMRLRPGCSFESLQVLMHKVAAAGLLKLGILKRPDDGVKATDFAEQERDRAKEARDDRQLVEEILASGVTTAFFPHGLGHSLGLDVHDSPLASRPDGPSDDPLAKYLRFRRTLEEGNVVTIEPGIYFNPFLLKPFRNSPYLDQDVLKRYMPVGGVRIEDEYVK